jgi:hypothetical protein
MAYEHNQKSTFNLVKQKWPLQAKSFDEDLKRTYLGVHLDKTVPNIPKKSRPNQNTYFYSWGFQQLAGGQPATTQIWNKNALCGQQSPATKVQLAGGQPATMQIWNQNARCYIANKFLSVNCRTVRTTELHLAFSDYYGRKIEIAFTQWPKYTNLQEKNLFKKLEEDFVTYFSHLGFQIIQKRPSNIASIGY